MTLRRNHILAGLGALVLAWIVPEREPVVSALTGEALPGVSLELSFGYLVLGPILGTLDYLTVLTVPQHVTVLVGLFLAYGLWRIVRRRDRRGIPMRVLVETGSFAAFFLVVLGFYGGGVLAPRPMAKLVVDDPDTVVVDFHSHTNASHDGRWDFDAERNRAWHRGAGFHVAYITDHDSIAPAYRALERNPARAGDDTVLLPGREVVYAGQHVIAFGPVDPRTGEGEWLPDPAAPAAPHAVDGEEEPARWCEGWPVLIQTIPNDLSRVPVPACTARGGGVEAIQLIDGDPRGLAQSDLEFERILAIADSLDIVLVSASNLHGWGSTAASWNLMRIPGWRDMAPEEVGAVIERMVRFGGRDAVEVVTYRRPSAATASGRATLGAALSLPTHFIGLRSKAERTSWLVWLALVMLVAGALKRRRERSGLLG
jgi:hypothetical protein